MPSWVFFNERLHQNNARTINSAGLVGCILRDPGEHLEARQMFKAELQGATNTMDTDDKEACVEWALAHLESLPSLNDNL